MPLPPPPDGPKRGRGKRTISGAVPPLPLLSPADVASLTGQPGAADSAYPQPIEIPREVVDPTALTVLEGEEFKGVLYEVIRRKSEALKLFIPMPEQERFFSCESGERVALGGNRGGKTTVTCVEIARAVTGQDPHNKYPKTGGKCILVGLDLRHCSKVFYEKLFMPGAFKVIRDEITKEWRSYRPNDPDDQARSTEARKAPPLIPKRFYNFDKIAWENKKDQTPKTIPLNNGWTLYFFSSIGAPPNGWDVDLVAFDEEIDHPLWYPEMAARLLDRRQKNTETGKVQSGKFIWSATPQAGTQQLYELKCRGDELKEALTEMDLDQYGKVPTPGISVFEYGMLDNPWVGDDAKQEFISKFADNQDEIDVRVHGKFALLGTRVYSDFMPKGVHGCESFQVPESWTSYAVIDPGRQVCAVLFIAVAPPGTEWAGRKIIYDMLYIKRCDAKTFAKAFVQRVNGRPIEYGIIDHRAGRCTEIGSGRTVEQQYSDALKAEGFKFERGGHGFMAGNDEVKNGIEAVRKAMHIIEGKTELVVMRDKVEKLLWEMRLYSYKKLPSGVVTDEPIKLNDHAVDCLRYACMATLKYVKPRVRKAAPGYTTIYLEQKKARAKNRAQKLGGFGGSYKVG